MIIVCGGGPAGVSAAIAAARGGAEVLLIEKYGFLGGMATSALVQPWMGYYSGDVKVIGGIFDEIVIELKKYGAFKQSEHLGNVHYCFDPEILKKVLQDVCLKAGVRILYHSFVAGIKIENNKIKGVYVENKQCRKFYEADYFIDCTGDADIAHFAGAPYEKGRQKDGLMQPVTLNFRLDNVDVKRMPSREEINEKYLQLKKEGKIDNPRENVLWFDTPYDGSIHFNTTRVNNIDGTKAEDLTLAEIVSHKQMMQVYLFLKENIPGFENSFIAASGPAIGVRETRRITGDYVLTEDDVLSGKKFDDGIASGCYAIDIHNPEGGGTVIKKVPEGSYYNIPYRCLLPGGVDNLIVAGRPVSTTHEAHSSVRIQACCYAMGQAAGTGASLCEKENKSFRELDVNKLRKILVSDGVIL
ncbi:MAG: FAD-dependent oxidoreductase [Armatimonadota bacterium]